MYCYFQGNTNLLLLYITITKAYWKIVYAQMPWGYALLLLCSAFAKTSVNVIATSKYVNW